MIADGKKGRGAPDELAEATPAPPAQAAHAHPSRLAYLDGWRGLSILAVLVGHFIGTAFIDLSRLGVEMFFVLSGRLMAQILFVERFPLHEFYRRRIARILPALVVFLGISCLVFRNDPYLGAKFKAAAASLAFIYNYLAAAGHRSAIFDHTWSLCVEEHSYILLAILAWAVRRGRIPLRPALLIGAVLSMSDGALSTILLKQDWFTAYWRTDTHIASILVSAWLFLTVRDFGDRVPSWLSPVCAVLGMLTFKIGMPEYVVYSVGTTLLAIGVATIDRAWSGFRALLSVRAITTAGVLSYSVYLWQQPFYQIAVWKLKLPPNSAIWWAVPAIACGVLSYVLVEKPSRRWLNSLRYPFLQHAQRAAPSPL
jgi:peptidoglycan/LPS O-acetylase OafA/YrhL